MGAWAAEYPAITPRSSLLYPFQEAILPRTEQPPDYARVVAQHQSLGPTGKATTLERLRLGYGMAYATSEAGNPFPQFLPLGMPHHSYHTAEKTARDSQHLAERIIFQWAVFNSQPE